MAGVAADWLACLMSRQGFNFGWRFYAINNLFCGGFGLDRI
jgi:hypothetical protein